MKPKLSPPPKWCLTRKGCKFKIGTFELIIHAYNKRPNRLTYFYDNTRPT